ncbi:hypothetical protein IMZ48_37310 [Candidatus Bathyarchaeota archaeon]|nr:hypothetical protein [Candidatus Bathyarchaeota archaeon]
MGLLPLPPLPSVVGRPFTLGTLSYAFGLGLRSFFSPSGLLPGRPPRRWG